MLRIRRSCITPSVATAHNLLLESAEIDSKQDLKSLMLIDAAVRIVCRGKVVTLEALTDNGLNVLQTLEGKMPADITAVREGRQLELTFPSAERALDEDSRLRQTTSFDALRMIQHAFNIAGHQSEAYLSVVFSPMTWLMALSHCQASSRKTAARTTCSILPRPYW